MIKEEQTGGSALAHFSKAIVSQPGRERIAPAPFGGHVVVHATAEETGGTLGMWETFTPPGKGPHDHTHTRETETFRIIRGMYRFRCGDDEFDAHPGAVVVLPPNIPHSFRNIGDEPGQMFATVTPGGFEQMFFEIGKSGANTVEAIATIEARFGIVNAQTKALGLT